MKDLPTLVVADVPVRRDAAGRYSLNDLHRAAGGEKRHGPSYWQDADQAKDLIGLLKTTGIPVVTKEGRNGGTYVVKELVYAYAMWISPAFHLKVIRAYDAMATGSLDVLTADDIERMMPAFLNRFGGVIKAVVHKQINDALSAALPGLVHGYLSSNQTALRSGVTAGQVVEQYGFEAPRNFDKWLSHQLCVARCQIEGGGRGELGRTTAKLFDPDKVAAAMKTGLRLLCERYLASKRASGQGEMFALRAPDQKSKKGNGWPSVH